MDTLQDFATGDTDYIAKLDSNNAKIAAAVAALETSAASAVQIGNSLPLLLRALFGGSNALLGRKSYRTSVSGTVLTVAAGYCYINSTGLVVNCLTNTDLDFSGKSADTYYISLDANAVPIIGTSVGATTIHSAVWTGTAFGTISRVAHLVAQPYSIAGFCNGAPSASQVILRYVVEHQVFFEPALLDSRAKANTGPTGSPVFNVAVNGGNVGTITFSSVLGTFATTTTVGIALDPGDVITVIAPSSPDATLADICVTLAGWLDDVPLLGEQQ